MNSVLPTVSESQPTLEQLAVTVNRLVRVAQGRRLASVIPETSYRVESEWLTMTSLDLTVDVPSRLIIGFHASCSAKSMQFGEDFRITFLLDGIAVPHLNIRWTPESSPSDAIFNVSTFGPAAVEVNPGVRRLEVIGRIVGHVGGAVVGLPGGTILSAQLEPILIEGDV